MEDVTEIPNEIPSPHNKCTKSHISYINLNKIMGLKRGKKILKLDYVYVCVAIELLEFYIYFGY